MYFERGGLRGGGGSRWQKETGAGGDGLGPSRAGAKGGDEGGIGIGKAADGGESLPQGEGGVGGVWAGVESLLQESEGGGKIAGGERSAAGGQIGFGMGRLAREHRQQAIFGREELAGGEEDRAEVEAG